VGKIREWGGRGEGCPEGWTRRDEKKVSYGMGRKEWTVGNVRMIDQEAVGDKVAEDMGKKKRQEELCKVNRREREMDDIELV
jgi:hypothetical protein